MPEEDPLSVFYPEEKEQKFDDDLYKKWFKTKDKAGFLSIRTWLDAGKVSIDIGETNTPTNTQVWTNAIEFAVYLQAVKFDRAEALYRGNQADPAESFTYYGGGRIDGKDVSRILKITHWYTNSGDTRKYDSTGFMWKCGHFEARKTHSGAFIPDMAKRLSMNSIKVSRLEMAEISYRLDLDLNAFCATNKDAFRSLNGKNK